MAKHFSDKEVEGLKQVLVNALDAAREFSDIPFVITSGYRNPDQNQAAGGVKGSAHEQGLAVDLRHGGDPIVASRIAYGLARAGFIRCGFYDKHIHADLDPTKPQVTWQGDSH